MFHYELKAAKLKEFIFNKPETTSLTSSNRYNSNPFSPGFIYWFN